MPDPIISIAISPSPDTHCDTETIKVALNLLLSNALKLASSANTPVIEFGMETQMDTTVFYTRNNGTGFDLGEDSSLLSMFRRLQAGTEFAGAGIALLTATIIVQRQWRQIVD